MTQYHKFLKSWTTDRGITSFLGSDKQEFQQDWKEEKKPTVRFGETIIAKPKMEIITEPMEIAEPTVSEKKTGLKILPKKSLELAEQRYAESKTQLGKERLGMETEDYKARTRERQKVGGGAKASGGGAKPKPKPKPTTDQIEKNKLQQKIHTLPTELRNIIKGYTVGDFTSEQRKELTDLYENISYIYEAVSTAQYNINGEFDTPIYKPSGTAGRTPAVKSLFKEVAHGMFDILEEIDRVLNWEEKDRDLHRYEIYGGELQDYGLTSREDGYLFTNKVATAQLREDKKKIPEFQKQLNRILKRADVPSKKTYEVTIDGDRYLIKGDKIARQMTGIIIQDKKLVERLFKKLSAQRIAIANKMPIPEKKTRKPSKAQEEKASKEYMRRYNAMIEDTAQGN